MNNELTDDKKLFPFTNTEEQFLKGTTLFKYLLYNFMFTYCIILFKISSHILTVFNPHNEPWC